MKKILILFFITACQPDLYVKPLPNAHAHNDYMHDRPLLDALDNGFTSVEADVHLIEGKLLVTHDAPENPNAVRTLEEVYLTPLKRHIAKNDGKVYKGYTDSFYLMIDFKTEALPTYIALKKVLAKYESMLTIVNNGIEQKNGPVKVFISGNRPYSEIMQEEVKLATLDGRPDDLGKDIPSVYMPVVSQNVSSFLSWTGEGEIDSTEKSNLLDFINKAHKENKKVRLWATPDTPEAWNFLTKSGVDLINTDRLSELRVFLNK
ncbi:phosphatidylinositol-specific phospholipase C/glycerophosphodiester phosphodiesterase family protein [Reichenbachiella sp. MALMAid0571]|uniref:phosphatidylinositol-specific phospholipase C/glycerophosphodiester phosphodiesterase family protein n=1 Tax=Reichenbachiella sp. MALMAid0571 TaxID=3143939 RepID=UPI0032DF7B46